MIHPKTHSPYEPHPTSTPHTMEENVDKEEVVVRPLSRGLLV